MVSVKKYSKKKSRFQQKVQTKVQRKVQRKVQVRSNKKGVNRGTKKLKRSKSRKNTKKKYQSGGKWYSLIKNPNPNSELLLNPNPNASSPVVDDVKAIFFDVDGTLSDAHCGGENVEYDPEQYNELLNLLDMLKKEGVMLFILTRCSANFNLCNGTRTKEEAEEEAEEEATDKQKSAIDYYGPILEFMDGIFSADNDSETDSETKSFKIDPFKIDPFKTRNMNIYYWAFLKSKYMEQFIRAQEEEVDKRSVVLIDDNKTNAIVAANQGFRSYSKASGNALDMTNNALKDIIKGMGMIGEGYKHGLTKFISGKPGNIQVSLKKSQKTIIERILKSLSWNVERKYFEGLNKRRCEGQKLVKFQILGHPSQKVLDFNEYEFSENNVLIGGDEFEELVKLEVQLELYKKQNPKRNLILFYLLGKKLYIGGIGMFLQKRYSSSYYKGFLLIDEIDKIGETDRISEAALIQFLNNPEYKQKIIQKIIDKLQDFSKNCDMKLHRNDSLGTPSSNEDGIYTFELLDKTHLSTDDLSEKIREYIAKYQFQSENFSLHTRNLIGADFLLN